MFHRVRQQVGTAGLIVAVVALVAALAGGAYAASGGLSGKQKKQVKHIAKNESKKWSKKYSKQFGKQGAKGETGAQGPKGDTGAQGPKGENGATGEAGMCSAGNPECKLASGAMLTGVWAASNPTESETTTQPYLSQISFPVRVSPAPVVLVTHELGPYQLGLELGEEAVVFYGPHPGLGTPEELEEDEAAFLEACPGSASEPEAAPGFLCVYKGVKVETHTIQLLESASESGSKSGVVVPWQVGAESNIRGTWAVTAE